MAAVQILLKRLRDKTKKLRENSDSDIKHANRALPPLPPHYIDEYGFGADGKRKPRVCDSPAHIYEEIPDFIVPTVTTRSRNKAKRSPVGDTSLDSDRVPSIGDIITTENSNVAKHKDNIQTNSNNEDLHKSTSKRSSMGEFKPELNHRVEPKKTASRTDLQSQPKKSFQVNDVFFQAARESTKSVDSADISSSDYNGSCDSYGSALSSTSPTSSKRSSIKSGNSLGNASNGTFNEYDINADLDNMDDIDTAYTFSPSDGFHDSGGSFGDIEDSRMRTREYHLYDNEAKTSDQKYFNNLNFCQCSQCYQAEIAEQYSDKSDAEYDYFLAKVHQNHTLKQQVVQLIKSSTDNSDNESVSHTLPTNCRSRSKKLSRAHASISTDIDTIPPFSSPSKLENESGHPKKLHAESRMFRKKGSQEASHPKPGSPRQTHSVNDTDIHRASTLTSTSKRTVSHKAEKRKEKQTRKTLEEILSLDEPDHSNITSSKDDTTINAQTTGAFHRMDRLSCRVTNYNPNKLRQNLIPLTSTGIAQSDDLYGSMYGNHTNVQRQHSNRMLSDMIRQNNHRQSFLFM
ncbi:unnamed protein product [Owenia fusiformis]|uniref:Uncharacterized protein n=1 Tax=Owenia fusiformis TaxID=6347 RepID=A0A8S4Q2P0_OWEFU|nr:unnamed protein product [Owenia fusiformis]